MSFEEWADGGGTNSSACDCGGDLGGGDAASEGVGEARMNKGGVRF
jgi:hypothetical protein